MSKVLLLLDENIGVKPELKKNSHLYGIGVERNADCSEDENLTTKGISN